MYRFRSVELLLIKGCVFIFSVKSHYNLKNSASNVSQLGLNRMRMYADGILRGIPIKCIIDYSQLL